MVQQRQGYGFIAPDGGSEDVFVTSARSAVRASRAWPRGRRWSTRLSKARRGRRHATSASSLRSDVFPAPGARPLTLALSPAPRLLCPASLKLHCAVARRALRESRQTAGAAGLPGSAASGASRGGRGRPSLRPGAGTGRRARGQGRSSPLRQASPDRAGLAARRGGGPRDCCRSQSDASGCSRAAGGRPRGGGPARGAAPRAAGRASRRARRHVQRHDDGCWSSRCARGATRRVAETPTRPGRSCTRPEASFVGCGFGPGGRDAARSLHSRLCEDQRAGRCWAEP